MSSKIFGFLLSSLVALTIAILAFVYLDNKNNKQTFTKSHPLQEMLETIDYRFNDLKYKLRKPQKSQARVVLLAIDDASVQEVGRWPWSRDLMAQILQGLVDNGASSVGLDVIFSEPEKAFPENDKKLASVVESYKSKIILGTFSNNELHIRPYQDYCVTEAFLFSGGDQIAKINTSLLVDDETDVFDDVSWDQLFTPLFQSLQESVKQAYLKERDKKEVSELSVYQRNHLKSLQQSALFSYCSVWLTKDDFIFNENKDMLLKTYSDLFFEKFPDKASNTEAKLDAFKTSVKEHPSPQYGEWVPNIPEVQAPADLTSSFVTFLDVDGSIRRYPLFYRSGNRLGTSYIPSLALQMYLSSTGWRSEAVIKDKKKQKEIVEFKIIDGSQEKDRLVQKLPIDSQGRMLVNYYGPQSTLPYVSAKDLLNDEPDVTVYERVPEKTRSQVILSKTKVNKKEFFKNRAVLIGATSMGIYDLRNTPVETNYPGPEIHLTMLANLLDQNYLKSIPGEDIKLPLILLIFGIVLSLLLAQIGAVSSMISFFFFMVAGGALDYYFFYKHHYVYSSYFVMALITGVHAVAVIYKYLSEERKKQALKRTFSKYVAPAVVDEILKDEKNLKLGGKKQGMTVFFSDVRGFTKFSEKMDPEELAQFLTEYLTPMTAVIFKNKGTLDKYMGDGLMAFFGAPIPYTDHAISACQAALDSLDQLKILKEAFRKKNWPDIDIGIGINTGSMSVGNMGSEIVQSYTVIGDAVNLGSRLEGTTKQYGVRILVSESTYLIAQNDFVFREVDRVRVVGKKEPIGAFELISKTVDADKEAYLVKYKKAYSLYTQKQFLEAQNVFASLAEQNPQDLLVSIYQKRCEDFLSEPPPEDWDGVFEMKSK